MVFSDTKLTFCLSKNNYQYSKLEITSVSTVLASPEACSYPPVHLSGLKFRIFDAFLR